MRSILPALARVLCVAPLLGALAAKCELDCSLNGVEIVAKDGTCTCKCDPAWTGSYCQTLFLEPAERESGLRQISVAAAGPNGTIAGNTSTWGGATVYDANEKRWFMWATELTKHCGMHTWTTNSHTVRASCATPTGLYTREAEQFPVWSHEVDVVLAPPPAGNSTGAPRYVAFYSAMPTGKAPECTTCKDGSTAKDCKKMAEIEVSPPTMMSYSLTGDPRGAWSKPQLVLLPKPEMDINAAPIIRPDGSVVGMWRDHHGYKKPKFSTPHIFTASNWSDVKTYKYNSLPLFSDKVVKGGIEDMFLWVDARGNYHALFHLMYGCGTCGSHAYSKDGLKWVYTGECYTSKTVYKDGGEVEYGYCERPHLVFDESGTTPIALTNGVKMGTQPGIANDDQSFTLLRPLRTAA